MKTNQAKYKSVGPVLPDNQIKCHPQMSLSGIPTAFNNAPGGDPRTLRAAASGMTALLNSINPSPALRAPSPARGEGNDIRPSSPRSVGMRGIGAPHTLYPTLQVCGITKGVSRGFTLIELLVVILIIGILAAIALPQYQKAVEKAHLAEAMSVSNLWEKATDLYVLTYSLPTTGGVQFLGNDATASLDIDWPSFKGCDADGCWSNHYYYAFAYCDTNRCVLDIYRIKQPGPDTGSFHYYISIYKNLNEASWKRDCDYVDELGESICKQLASQGWATRISDERN